ncbi:polyprenyl synthetase family protein [Saccharomonospora sp. NPDC046836]|uniref:polyprenyl synthetase family protein n=1 Tax=Saccharomonospora sp. NPDC046836 TaxID=3156921 RepID=UPI00340779FA
MTVLRSSAPPTQRTAAPTSPPGQDGLDLRWVRQQVDAVMNAFVDRKKSAATRAGLPVDIPQAIGEFLAAGGKRIRPLLCVLGWHAAGASGSPAQAVQAGAALEMFHAFCLIHDDVMDHSDTRRGQPAVHRSLAARHRSGRSRALAENIGIGSAILAGDLALVWSDELLHHAATELTAARRERVLPLVDLMRAEVMYGQYLDLTSTGRPTAHTAAALEIIRYKTAKYTIERPLQIGAAIAGADDQLLDALSAFALPLGDAFQLRDDLLGVFGTQKKTGKPAVDDLREGKHTVLIALALQLADPFQQRLLRSLYGTPRLDEEGAATVRTVLKATGADQAVEQMITNRYEQALPLLDTLPIPTEVQHHLRALADQAVWRTA